MSKVVIVAPAVRVPVGDEGVPRSAQGVTDPALEGVVVLLTLVYGHGAPPFLWLEWGSLCG